MAPGPDVSFWQARYEQQNTPWDDGSEDAELAAWLADGTLGPADGPVLAPGCGSGRELVQLAAAGLEAVGLDYTPAAVALARERLQQAGLKAEVIEADVLQWTAPQPFGAVFERTCLCALHPDQWLRYVEQLRAWLRPGGRLFVQFEQVPREGAMKGLVEGPPYHCDINAMRALFPPQHWRWQAGPPTFKPDRLAGHLTTLLTRL